MATEPPEDSGAPSALARSMGKNSALLSAFALLATVGIAGTFVLTKARIAEQEYQARARALLEIVPKSRHDNDLLSDSATLASAEAIEALRLNGSGAAYTARRDGEAIAVIFPSVAPDGYTGDIELLVGVDRDGRIAGVRITKHRETPGLGDKVDLRKSAWALSFNGASLREPTLSRWGVKKDGGHFDQFTGATITPRAVVAAVRRTLQYAERHRETLFGNPQSGERGEGGEGGAAPSEPTDPSGPDTPDTP